MTANLEIKSLENPSFFQPPYSNFDATEVEACRICLATDIRLYSLRETNLGRCMEYVSGFNKSYKELPNYVCYQCTPCLVKCQKFIEKSKTAEATLKDIFTKNGQITKSLIEEQNRSQLNLESPLDSYLLLNYFHIKYDDDNNTSEYINVESNSKENIKIIKNELKNETIDESSDSDTEYNMIHELLTNGSVLNKTNPEENNSNQSCDDDIEEIKQDIPVVEIISDDEKAGDDFISLKSYKVKLDKGAKGFISQNLQKPIYNVPKLKGSLKNKKKKNKRKYIETLTPLTSEETILQKYFKINTIPLPKTQSKKYTCKSCPKTFNSIDDAKDHRFLGCMHQQRSTIQPETTPAYQPRFWIDWEGNANDK